MRANFARPDIRENEEASTGFDRRGANTRIIYWSSLSRIIIPRGMHFAGKLTDQYLIPTRTASRRERVSGRQSFKNAERFRVSRGCCCWWFAGGFLRETRISLEGVAHFCLLGWPPGCVIVDIIPATCWRTRRVLASTKNNLERGNIGTSLTSNSRVFHRWFPLWEITRGLNREFLSSFCLRQLLWSFDGTRGHVNGGKKNNWRLFLGRLF